MSIEAWQVIASSASAVAALCSAAAAWKSFGVATKVAQANEHSRRMDALREWRQANVSVIAEGGGCLAMINVLKPSVDAAFVLAGGFGGSPHDDVRTLVAGIESSIRSAVKAATGLRTKDAAMYEASIGDIEKALTEAHERLSAVRMATNQVAMFQARMDSDRDRFLAAQAGNRGPAPPVS